MASSGEQPSYSSDYFSDSENGSLSDLNDSYVSPNVTIILQGSLHYTVLEIVTLSIIMTAMIIVIVIGNMLVVIAISTENNLKSIQNWFIASLAIADMLLGLLVMPFSLAYELMAYWMFGEIWCEIHGALDVFLCTASILNICLISLDRYWSITNSIAYLNQRTPSKVFVMIITVWVLSGLISIPPLLGWKAEGGANDSFVDSLLEKENQTNVEIIRTPDPADPDQSNLISIANYTESLEAINYPQCGLSKDIGYVMYSAFGSFYIPSCIMVFVYIKIYFAARDRARRVVKKLHFSKRISRRFAKPKPVANGGNENNGEPKSNGPRKFFAPKSIEADHVTTISGAIGEPSCAPPRTANRVRIQEPNEMISRVANDPAEANHSSAKPLLGTKPTIFNKKGRNGAVVTSETADYICPSATEVVHFEPARTDAPHAFGACVLKESCTRRSVGVSTRSEHELKKMEDKNSKASKKHYLFYSCKKRKFFHSSETTSGNNSKNNNEKKRKTSKETRDQIDLGSTTYVSSKQNKIKGCQKKKNNSKVPINIAPVLPNYNKSSLEKDADREKKRIARKKERRATLILGLIMGSFIACWFPFFFLYSISPVCPICEDSPTSPCCVMGWGFSFAFWLGYSNSALNPVIYTIFNKDFRQAFKRILFR